MSTDITMTPPQAPVPLNEDGLIALVKTLSHLDSPLKEIFASVNQYFYGLLGNSDTVLLSSLGLAADECQITYQKSRTVNTSWKCIDLLNTTPAAVTLKSEFIATVNAIEAPTLMAEVDRRQSGLPQSLSHYPALLILPIFLHGVSKHKLLLCFKRLRPCESHETQKLMLVANLLMSYLIHNCEIKSLNDANQWIEKEVTEVGNLLKMLLPQREVDIRGVEVATSYKPCEHAGGDYYDLVSLTKVFWPEADTHNDYWGAIIVDSAGHGAAAAVEVAMFDAILRTYRGNPDTGPAGVFNYANQYLFTRLIRGTFLTALIANYNPFTKSLRFANAGHPPALLIRADSLRVEFLDNPKGIPLAVNKDYKWQNGHVDFHPGDVLILYTDGVSEAAAPDGTLFGIERLVDTALNGTLQAGAVVQRLEAALLKHQQGRKQKDDQTIIAIKLASAPGDTP